MVNLSRPECDLHKPLDSWHVLYHWLFMFVLCVCVWGGGGGGGGGYHQNCLIFFSNFTTNTYRYSLTDMPYHWLYMSFFFVCFVFLAPKMFDIFLIVRKYL